SMDVLRLVAAQARKFPEVAGSYAKSGPEKVRRALADYLRDRADAGEVKLRDFDTAAAVFFDLLRSRLQMRAMFDASFTPTPEELRETVDRAVRVFMGGAEAI